MTTRRVFLSTMAAGLAAAQSTSGRVTKYVRYRHAGGVSYGILDGQMVRELRGDLFGKHAETGTQRKLSEVKLLHPCVPPKVFAVGLNYKSHIGDRPAPKVPEMFYKPTTSVADPEANIVIPEGAKNVHYEAELVIVMGKRASNVSVADAPNHIFGYTCGNDVSERDWQKNDLQWWRAKGSDTFGPFGPAIVTALDPKAKIRLRLNGDVKQEQFLSDLIHGPAQIVSFTSRFVTLEPGDVIFTGTPGTTSAMKPGDVVEVEIDGIGILRNKVVSHAGNS
jgi:2-keto-4-pentenoate hydratase/2-oxohepta-3-ene-1,7-dioic acid hydratase in catechol pathway